MASLSHTVVVCRYQSISPADWLSPTAMHSTSLWNPTCARNHSSCHIASTSISAYADQCILISSLSQLQRSEPSRHFPLWLLQPTPIEACSSEGARGCNDSTQQSSCVDPSGPWLLLCSRRLLGDHRTSYHSTVWSRTFHLAHYLSLEYLAQQTCRCYVDSFDHFQVARAVLGSRRLRPEIQECWCHHRIVHHQVYVRSSMKEGWC